MIDYGEGLIIGVSGVCFPFELISRNPIRNSTKSQGEPQRVCAIVIIDSNSIDLIIPIHSEISNRILVEQRRMRQDENTNM